MSKKIEIGDKAPDFTLPANNGENINLNEVLKDKAVVLYFYPRDNTPKCTAQACSFRDSYEDFKKENAEVIGISSDSSESHIKFTDSYKLPFKLVSDKSDEIRKLYGVPANLFGIIPGRVTYIIDKKGIVRHIFNSQLNTDMHIEKSLEILKFINKEN